MKDANKNSVLTNTEELRKLITEHPEYPIAILCGDEAANMDYTYTYAKTIRYRLGEILDCEQPVNDEVIFNDREDFYTELEEMIRNAMSEELSSIIGTECVLDEEAIQKVIEEEKAKYEPFWRKCIVITADN